MSVQCCIVLFSVTVSWWLLLTPLCIPVSWQYVLSAWPPHLRDPFDSQAWRQSNQIGLPLTRAVSLSRRTLWLWLGLLLLASWLPGFPPGSTAPLHFCSPRVRSSVFPAPLHQKAHRDRPQFSKGQLPSILGRYYCTELNY